MPTISNKVVASTLSGAVVTILVWAIELFGVTVPGEVAAAMTTVVGGLAGYITPHQQ